MTDGREEFIRAQIAAGKTREQAEAFLDLVRSAFARRGWAPGEPLDDEQRAAAVDALLGTEDQDQP